VTTIGIEIETTNVQLSRWEEVEKPRGWSAVTDGSIRTLKRTFLPIENMKINGREGTKFGAEMVSPIIKCGEDMWGGIIRILSLVKDSGEVTRANNSIHIHVGMPDIPAVIKGWEWLKEIDKILFDISAPGGIPRGLYNDFIYYRPLNSPQWARQNDDLFLPSIGQVENATTEYDLQVVMGRYDRMPPKWYASRYCGINLVALFCYGTLEFRHFNFTSDLRTLKTWIFLCVGIKMALLERSTTTKIESLIYKGAKEYNYTDITSILDGITLDDIYSKVDLTPIRTHTNRGIDWTAPIGGEISVPLKNLLPKDMTKSPREIRDAHPCNALTEKEPEMLHSFIMRNKNLRGEKNV